SALAQEDVEAQVVVVDDGSAAETAGRLPGGTDQRALRRRHQLPRGASGGDPRLLVLRHDRPRGVSAARNLVLSRVTATWVAFLDDDDVWAPRHLATMLDAAGAPELDAARVGLVYSGHLVVDGEREVIGTSPA